MPDDKQNEIVPYDYFQSFQKHEMADNFGLLNCCTTYRIAELLL